VLVTANFSEQRRGMLQTRPKEITKPNRNNTTETFNSDIPVVFYRITDLNNI